MTTSIKKRRSDEADAKIQDGFASTDWNMFRDSSDGIGVEDILVVRALGQ